MADYKLLVFDWDGTLVDSIGRIVEAITAAAEAERLCPPSEEAIRGIIGLAMPEAVATLYPELAADRQGVADFQAQYAKYYLALESTPSPFYPGVADTLQRFRDQGYRLAVATGKTRRGLDRVMSGHGWMDFFDVTRCADETASKPDPRMLHEILDHCQVAPAQALMVGDSSFDLHMAHNAGITPIGVSYGAQPVERLQACEPALMIDRFEQLAAWLAASDLENR